MNRRDFFKKTSVVGGGIAAIATTNLMASTKDVGATRKDSFSYVDYESVVGPTLLKNIENCDVGITFSLEDINKIKHIFDEILDVCNETFWAQLPCRNLHCDINGGFTYGDVKTYPFKILARPGILNYNLNVLSYSIRCHLMLTNHQSVVPCGLRDLKKRRPFLMHSGEIAGDNGLFCNINSETIVLNSWFTTQS